MFTKKNEIDRIFGTLDTFTNRMNRLFDDFEQDRLVQGGAGTWSRTNFFDDGDSIFVYCQLPGVEEKDLEIHLHNNLLTLKGTRVSGAPEDYAILRQERDIRPFSRTFNLPVEIDAGKTAATLKNGLLMVKLAKSQAARPKKITVTVA